MDLSFLLPMAGGVVGGLAANAARLPGGAVLGALAGAAATQLALGTATALPDWVRIAGQIGIGGAVGVRLAPTALRRLGHALLWALILLGVLVLTAIGAGLLYAGLSGMPVGVGMLATMPGGVAEVVAVSLEAGDDAAIIAAVHLGRQLLILVVLGAGLRFALGCMHSPADADRRSGT